MKRILAFETSCDDTAVAILSQDGRVLGDAIFSQLAEHAPYGGVVPEIGSRAHIEQIAWVTREAFHKAQLKPNDIDIVAATFAPGLVGPLLVGAHFAKGFAVSRSLPLIAIHHIEGHILSGFGEEDFCTPPFVSLIVSGGHTALYSCDENYSIHLLGETLDDAAGEAFDKIGRAMGFSYPAGRLIDQLAEKGCAQRFQFPKALRTSTCLNFSFSGLKTHALSLLRTLDPLDEASLADFCASLREAVSTSLCERALRALLKTGHRALVLGGGVAANSRLRLLLIDMCKKEGIKLFLPDLRLCTDNAVMIGRAAAIKLRYGKTSTLFTDVSAQLSIEEVNLLYKN